MRDLRATGPRDVGVPAPREPAGSKGAALTEAIARLAPFFEDWLDEATAGGPTSLRLLSHAPRSLEDFLACPKAQRDAEATVGTLLHQAPEVVEGAVCEAVLEAARRADLELSRVSATFAQHPAARPARGACCELSVSFALH